MITTYLLPATFNKNNVADELNKIAQSLSIDCANVIDIDSAGIAALVYLLSKKNCTIKNMTQCIINLCDLYQIKLSK